MLLFPALLVLIVAAAYERQRDPMRLFILGMLDGGGGAERRGRELHAARRYRPHEHGVQVLSADLGALCAGVGDRAGADRGGIPALGADTLADSLGDHLCGAAGRDPDLSGLRHPRPARRPVHRSCRARSTAWRICRTPPMPMRRTARCRSRWTLGSGLRGADLDAGQHPGVAGGAGSVGESLSLGFARERLHRICRR